LDDEEAENTGKKKSKMQDRISASNSIPPSFLPGRTPFFSCCPLLPVIAPFIAIEKRLWPLCTYWYWCSCSCRTRGRTDTSPQLWRSLKTTIQSLRVTLSFFIPFDVSFSVFPFFSCPSFFLSFSFSFVSELFLVAR
jgi:hypothetical protein